MLIASRRKDRRTAAACGCARSPMALCECLRRPLASALTLSQSLQTRLVALSPRRAQALSKAEGRRQLIGVVLILMMPESELGYGKLADASTQLSIGIPSDTYCWSRN